MEAAWGAEVPKTRAHIFPECCRPTGPPAHTLRKGCTSARRSSTFSFSSADIPVTKAPKTSAMLEQLQDPRDSSLRGPTQAGDWRSCLRRSAGSTDNRWTVFKGDIRDPRTESSVMPI